MANITNPSGDSKIDYPEATKFLTLFYKDLIESGAQVDVKGGSLQIESEKRVNAKFEFGEPQLGFFVDLAHEVITNEDVDQEKIDLFNVWASLGILIFSQPVNTGFVIEASVKGGKENINVLNLFEKSQIKVKKALNEKGIVESDMADLREEVAAEEGSKLLSAFNEEGVQTPNLSSYTPKTSFRDVEEGGLEEVYYAEDLGNSSLLVDEDKITIIEQAGPEYEVYHKLTEEKIQTLQNKIKEYSSQVNLENTDDEHLSFLHGSLARLTKVKKPAAPLPLITETKEASELSSAVSEEGFRKPNLPRSSTPKTSFRGVEEGGLEEVYCAEDLGNSSLLVDEFEPVPILKKLGGKAELADIVVERENGDSELIIWVENIDDNTQEYYWKNAETGEFTWIKPENVTIYDEDSLKSAGRTIAER
ncbi:MAG: hypothetical protein ACJAW3_001475, partial [Lentimonas sp.]